MLNQIAEMRELGTHRIVWQRTGYKGGSEGASSYEIDYNARSPL
ncbi:MAG: hypothetical protein ABSB35_38035 [Bryobacteraceae bacterium]